MLRPSQRFAQRMLWIAAALCAARIVMLSLAPPRKSQWSSGSSLALIAVWSSLGASPLALRWFGAAVSLWLIARAVPATGRGDLWSLSLAWDALPHVLLTFSVLCCLREYALSIRPADAPPPARARQFGLRKMFVWMAGIATITLGWKYVLDAAHILPQEHGRLGLFLEGAAMSTAMTAIDLTALWIVLASPRLHWRQILWIAVAVIVHTPILRAADAFLLGSMPPWTHELMFVAGHDVLYLVPLVTVLLLARAAGYRLVWAAC